VRFHFVEIFKLTRVYHLYICPQNFLIICLIGCAIVFCRNTVPEMSHQSLGRSKVIKTVKVYDAVVLLRVRYLVSTRPRRIVQIHNIARTFRFGARQSSVTHENTSKVMRICLASSFNCTVVIAPDGIFIVSLAVFFLCSYVLSTFVRAEIQSTSVFVRNEI